LFPDGWVALARTDPYRVDWRRPDGSVLHGTPLPIPLVRLDEREKRVALRRELRQQDVSTSLFKDWPEHLPPFRRDALLADPQGRVVIHRMPSADEEGQRYDIVDRAGRLAGFLRLPPNERIVGFGSRSIYIVVKDQDDIERLRRHPWP
jgi:hypothetical protein